jgi:hypothetical protein
MITPLVRLGVGMAMFTTFPDDARMGRWPR